MIDDPNAPISLAPWMVIGTCMRIHKSYSSDTSYNLPTYYLKIISYDENFLYVKVYKKNRIIDDKVRITLAKEYMEPYYPFLNLISTFKEEIGI